MIELSIEQWRAWAPGLVDRAAWQAWARSPHVIIDAERAQPACEFLPAMQRRRLGRLARMTLETAWPLCVGDEQLPFVFGSRHGETPHTYAVLAEVAGRQPLSPTRFGLSVHNAVAGQWSMLRGQRGESTALAGEADTFEHAVLEGAMLIADGATAVLVVMAEEMPPPAYDGWIDDVPFSYAVALRLGERTRQGAAGTRWRLRLDSGAAGAQAAWPHALDFLRALLAGEPTLEHACRTRRWNWQRLD